MIVNLISKSLIFLLTIAGLFITVCQKPIQRNVDQLRLTDVNSDSVISQGDTVTYEVLTACKRIKKSFNLVYVNSKPL